MATDPANETAPFGGLRAVNVGQAGRLRHGEREVETAFLKVPVEGPLWLGETGLPGDEHVHIRHGGPDKAVSVYVHDHYVYWERRLGLTLPASGAFGENFTISGLHETQVWLGDVFEVGEALVQVSQPRAPCFKISVRYRVPRFAVFLQDEGLTGYHLRVLREGHVAAGDTLRLVERADHGMTVAEANRILNVDLDDEDGPARLLAVSTLPRTQRPTLERRAAGARLEADLERLFGE